MVTVNTVNSEMLMTLLTVMTICQLSK